MCIAQSVFPLRIAEREVGRRRRKVMRAVRTLSALSG
jgi:hypothetical protein